MRKFYWKPQFVKLKRVFRMSDDTSVACGIDGYLLRIGFWSIKWYRFSGDVYGNIYGNMPVGRHDLNDAMIPLTPGNIFVNRISDMSLFEYSYRMKIPTGIHFLKMGV